MGLIEKSWEQYKNMVIPKNAPEIQITECRQAFYAGASILFTSIIMFLEAGKEPTDSDMEKMIDVQKEIDEFGEKLDRRYINSKEH